MKNTVKITFWIMLTAAVVLGINAGWDKYQEFRQAELARVMTVKDKKFDPGQLTEMAAALAAKPYVPPADNLPDELKKLNYDQYRDIRFSRENGPWFRSTKSSTAAFIRSNIPPLISTTAKTA